MKRSLCSCIVFALIFGVFSSFFCGCSKKKLDPLTGEDPGPWYDYSSYELGTQYDRTEYSYLGQQLLGTCKGKAVVCVTYQRHMPSDFDYINDDYSLYQGELFDLYDLTGQVVDSYTFDEIRERSGIPDDEYFYGDFNSLFISGEYVFFKTVVYANGNDGCNCYRMDPDTGIAEKIYGCDDPGMFVPGCGVADGYFYMMKGNYQDFSQLCIDVVSPEGEVGTIDVGAAFPNREWNSYSGIYNIGSGKILIPYIEDGSSTTYFCADLSALTISIYEEDLDWFTKYTDIYYLTEAEGFGPCITDDEGLKRIDFDGKTSEYVFNFDRCNANQVELTFSKLFMADEDTYVFGNSIWVNNLYDSYDIPVLIVLQKSDTDPTAGRDMIRLAPLYGMHYAMAEAVRIFNETNTDCYILVDRSYSCGRFYGEDSQNNYVYYGDSAGDPSEVAMTNKLMIDLMAGDGPDIIMGAMSFSQFCNPDILADMSDQLGDAEVFGNVIDACRTDGALYNVPLSFSLSGICTRRSSVQPDQTGFTFDQYDEFVRGVCNGNNPIKKEKTDFFLLCLGLMSSEFINENGRIDYDCDAFRQLACYVNDNVTYREPTEEEMDEDYWRLETIDEDTAAFYGTFSNLSEFVGRFNFEATETAMLGAPAVTPIGPSISYADSVAVTAGARHLDECGEFVRLLLSEDIQDLYVKFSATTPVNVDSYESSASAIIDAYNRNRADCINGSISTEDLISMGMAMPIENDDIIYDYEDYIRSATAISQSDPAIAAIVREEIPAYFEGQKTLDEVIAIICDRVDTYQNENR